MQYFLTSFLFLYFYRNYFLHFIVDTFYIYLRSIYILFSTLYSCQLINIDISRETFLWRNFNVYAIIRLPKWEIKGHNLFLLLCFHETRIKLSTLFTRLSRRANDNITIVFRITITCYVAEYCSYCLHTVALSSFAETHSSEKVASWGRALCDVLFLKVRLRVLRDQTHHSLWTIKDCQSKRIINFRHYRGGSE